MSKKSSKIIKDDIKKKKKKKSSFKDTMRNIIFIISIVVFTVCAFKLFNIWKGYHDNAKSYEEVQESFAPKQVINEDNGEKKYVLSDEDFDKLIAENPDFKAWITIEDTAINYPVVQTDNNEYYLTHNFKKQNNVGGALFITLNNSNPFEDKNTIIHGHHMRDGSMFADLMKFKDENFTKEHYIYISLKGKVLKYQVFSAFTETANDDSYQVGFATDKGYLDYINKLASKSLFKLDNDSLTENDKIITLSTCDYDEEDGRMLVCAKLISVENN
ncbi:MAG: class B sortase [Clostridiaceae bacterium]|nr:class B sortase [Clostridiaceae bacterium]